MTLVIQRLALIQLVMVAMKSIWSGMISFGLVNVPVKLYSAISDRDIHFHLLSPDGSCRLRRKLFCPETKKEYDFEQSARGYEIAPNQYVIVDEKELDRLKPESGSQIQVLDFVPLTEIDPIYFDRPYYLGPQKGGAHGYALLIQAMTKTEKAAIGTFVMRQHEYLAVIRPWKEQLCLHTMHYEDEILELEREEEVQNVKVSPRELKLAEELIENWSGKFEPSKYHSEYQKRLRMAVEKKAQGKDLVTPSEGAAARPSNVINLMDALKKSLRQGKPPKNSEKRSRPHALKRPAKDSKHRRRG